MQIQKIIDFYNKNMILNFKTSNVQAYHDKNHASKLMQQIIEKYSIFFKKHAQSDPEIDARCDAKN